MRARNPGWELCRHLKWDADTEMLEGDRETFWEDIVREDGRDYGVFRLLLALSLPTLILSSILSLLLFAVVSGKDEFIWIGSVSESSESVSRPRVETSDRSTHALYLPLVCQRYGWHVVPNVSSSPPSAVLRGNRDDNIHVRNHTHPYFEIRTTSRHRDR